MLADCMQLNFGGKALPIKRETEVLDMLVGNLYVLGKVCRSAASRAVMARFYVGCKNLPLEGLRHPPVIVDE